MRILQINAVFGYSSTGVITKDLFDCIQSHGGDSMAICVNSNVKNQKAHALGTSISNKLHALLTRLIGFQGCWSYLSSKRIIKRIQDQNPDIIHIHNLHSNFINLPLLLKYCSKYNKPLVVTMHDCWYFTGKCYHFEDIGCTHWQRNCGKCPKRMSDIPSLLCDSSHFTFNIKKRLFNNINNLYVVGCSKWITGKAKLSPVFKSGKFSTIYNGVDTSVFCYDQHFQEKKNPFTVMVMANKWFLSTNLLLREKLIGLANSDMRLKIVGCNPTQLAENQSSDFVTYIGYVNSRKELADHYRSSDIFMNVTFIDTLPTVNMEAICCGTPVITYRSGGSPELIEEDVTGYVIDQNDIDGIIKAIQRIKEHPFDRIRCAEIGKQRFDKDLNYKKYITLYNHILSD